jgi:hypothetical protein
MAWSKARAFIIVLHGKIWQRVRQAFSKAADKNRMRLGSKAIPPENANRDRRKLLSESVDPAFTSSPGPPDANQSPVIEHHHILLRHSLIDDYLAVGR